MTTTHETPAGYYQTENRPGFPKIHSADQPSRHTQTPPRRRAAKEITIDSANYANTHNREPRGYGTWIFTPTHATRDQDPNGKPLPPEEAREQRQALAIWITGTYARAKAAAARIAASQENAPTYWSTEP